VWECENEVDDAADAVDDGRLRRRLRRHREQSAAAADDEDAAGTDH
jgi:hypothetical protein